jgi:hypothetical protein
MLIVALVLAVIGLAALVTAVVTSNELIAWVCIAASVIGVVLLIVDALRERRGDGDAADETEADETRHADEPDEGYVEDYPDDTPAATEDETAAVPTESVDSDTTEVVEEDRNPR